MFVIKRCLHGSRAKHHLACEHHTQIIGIEPPAMHKRTFIGVNPATSGAVVLPTYVISLCVI